MGLELKLKNVMWPIQRTFVMIRSRFLGCHKCVYVTKHISPTPSWSIDYLTHYDFSSHSYFAFWVDTDPFLLEFRVTDVCSFNSHHYLEILNRYTYFLEQTILYCSHEVFMLHLDGLLRILMWVYFVLVCYSDFISWWRLIESTFLRKGWKRYKFLLL